MTKGVLWLYSEQIANRVLDNIVDQVTGTISPINYVSILSKDDIIGSMINMLKITYFRTLQTRNKLDYLNVSTNNVFQEGSVIEKVLISCMWNLLPLLNCIICDLLKGKEYFERGI